MRGENPCNICNSRDNCDGCVLDHTWDNSCECQNYDCMVYYECGCLLLLDEVCKASTCYKDEHEEDEENE